MHVLCLLALEEGKPAYDRTLARQVAALDIPTFASTPRKLLAGDGDHPEGGEPMTLDEVKALCDAPTYRNAEQIVGSNAITQMARSGNTLFAQVVGSSTYTVQIELHDSNPPKARCSCPARTPYPLLQTCDCCADSMRCKRPNAFRRAFLQKRPSLPKPPAVVRGARPSSARISSSRASSTL